MATLSGLWEVIVAFFKFPASFVAMVKLFKNTPVENHEALIKRIAAEEEKFDQTGRPTWD